MRGHDNRRTDEDRVSSFIYERTRGPAEAGRHAPPARVPVSASRPAAPPSSLRRNVAQARHRPRSQLALAPGGAGAPPRGEPRAGDGKAAVEGGEPRAGAADGRGEDGAGAGAAVGGDRNGGGGAGRAQRGVPAARG